MHDFIDDIEKLSPTLFDGIPSQTGHADRRALLAVQRAVARAHGRYAYLEIGSHLGGSLQPHLADPRCTKIYSIDARPLAQPDDRAPGFLAHYEDNSSARMLSLLGARGVGDLTKIVCFDSDAAEVEIALIAEPPLIAFIDGEHTRAAVRSDFAFCREAIDPRGAILLHDFSIVYPAIAAIRTTLRREGVPHLAVMLEGDVFGFFFDAALVHDDPYLSACRRRAPRVLGALFGKRLLKRALPAPLWERAKGVRDALRRELA